MQNVTCFVLQLAHLPVQRWGRSLQNLIEKICFLRFSITSYLTEEPISHTVCQSKDGGKKERQWRWGGKKKNKKKKCLLLTQNKRWLASYCMLMILMRQSWQCSKFLDEGWLTYVAVVIMFAQASNGTNFKSLTQFLKWVQKQSSLLCFPHLHYRKQKTLLVGLFCMYGLDEKQILNVSLKWRNMDSRSYWCSHWYAQQCFFFFVSPHQRPQLLLL